jgi:hypothetical protein
VGYDVLNTSLALGERFNLDDALRVMQEFGGTKILKHSRVTNLIQAAVLDLNYLHGEGDVLRKESSVLDLPAYLDYSKVVTNLTKQQRAGLLTGDTTDYRVWSLRWRLRGGGATTFQSVIPYLTGAGALKRIQAFNVNERALMLNAMEQMHRGRLSTLKNLSMSLVKLDELKG